MIVLDNWIGVRHFYELLELSYKRDRMDSDK